MAEVRISQLWRYPIKSLRGEALETATLTPDGIAGDRIVHIAGRRGPITGRTRHGLLTIDATTGPDGRPLIGNKPWDSPHAASPRASPIASARPARAGSWWSGTPDRTMFGRSRRES